GGGDPAAGGGDPAAGGGDPAAGGGDPAAGGGDPAAGGGDPAAGGAAGAAAPAADTPPAAADAAAPPTGAGVAPAAPQPAPPAAAPPPGAAQGASTSSGAAVSVQRAKLEIEGQPAIDCLFNPAQYAMTKVNNYQVQSVPGMSFGAPQFVGGAPREMTVELLFDVTLSQPAKPSVRPITDALFKMMEVPAGGAGSAGKAPPTVTFRWGAFESFKAVATRLDVQFVLFRADGEPVRAWTRMDLLQVAADPRSGSATPAAQNPTTRAAEAGSTCVVCDGDSLQSLAYDAYGDPTQWRLIARANDIHDPLRLRPGRRLTIPEVPA
ncbi:MAG: LysM peptidoglycan-binding domain-containing protein, partial [Thermoleophilia bacterium]